MSHIVGTPPTTDNNGELTATLAKSPSLSDLSPLPPPGQSYFMEAAPGPRLLFMDNEAASPTLRRTATTRMDDPPPSNLPPLIGVRKSLRIAQKSPDPSLPYPTIPKPRRQSQLEGMGGNI